MKKKLSARDIKILLILGAIAVLAATYFLVFTKLSEKKTELEGQNATLQNEVAELENMEARKDAVLLETAETQMKIADLLQHFPSEVRTQNVIHDLNEMYNSIDDVDIQSESYTMNQLFYQSAGATDEDGNPVPVTEPASVSAITAETPVSEIVSASAGYTGLRSDVTVVFTSPYNSLKKVIDFINDQEDRMTITNIAATKVEGSETLACNMTVSMYAVSGTGKDYAQPDVKKEDEKGNIFK